MSYQPTLKKIKDYIEIFEKKPELQLDKVREWMSGKDVNNLIKGTSGEWIMIRIKTRFYIGNSFFIKSEENEAVLRDSRY